MDGAGDAVTGSRVGPHTSRRLPASRRPWGGEVSARRLVEMNVGRIEALDRGGPRLRSVIEVNPEALAIGDVLDWERRASGNQQQWRGHRPRCASGGRRSYQLSPGERDWPLRRGLASLCFCRASSAFRLHALGSVTILTPPPRRRRRTCPRRRRRGEGARGVGNVSQWLPSGASRLVCRWRAACGGAVFDPRPRRGGPPWRTRNASS